ncbi:MAG: capsule assembly Wzi family protein [Phycisphaerae bacterium]|nr:capsule assembly Wzi family protein [Phycisphaerae bacterium]NIP55828.1 capsule assembly Wzi family protein [Phycisphaerae bacterium]NIX32215.1 hypothetical protein [Phycisphaerae bacterium]
MLKDRWSYRWYLETAVTSCDFWKSDEIFDCAYNHYIYQTGYRYKGRVIGHAADNDARVLTIGGAMVAPGNTFWHALIRVGRLNRGGTLDAENSLTIGPQNYSGVELIHSRATRLGRFDFGVGYHSFDKASHTLGSREFNAFIQWNSDT